MPADLGILLRAATRFLVLLEIDIGADASLAAFCEPGLSGCCRPDKKS
jgi:hypothetical protein